jgi:hypothetical protein
MELKALDAWNFWSKIDVCDVQNVRESSSTERRGFDIFPVCVTEWRDTIRVSCALFGLETKYMEG